MSQERVTVKWSRGGRQLREREFDLTELRTPFGRAMEADGVTFGLQDYEVYVRQLDGDQEISAHRREGTTLESVLREAAADGDVTGKTYVVDITAEHKGAEAPWEAES